MVYDAFLELKNVTNNTQNKWKIDQRQEKNKNDVSKLKLSFSYIQPKLNIQPKNNNNINTTDTYFNSPFF